MPAAATNRSFSFSARYRIKKSKEFQQIRETGSKLYAKHFLVLVAPSEAENSRLGVTITTKIDKRSVVRNKLKRRIREVFRLNRHLLNKNLDIVVIARRDAQLCTLKEIKQELLGALKAKGYLKKAPNSG